jgi:hypothetical protein
MHETGARSVRVSSPAPVSWTSEKASAPPMSSIAASERVALQAQRRDQEPERLDEP